MRSVGAPSRVCPAASRRSEPMPTQRVSPSRASPSWRWTKVTLRRSIALLPPAVFRLGRAVRRVFTEPFMSDPALALLPVEQRERLRRTALLRLVVTCLFAVQALAISLALPNRAPVGAVATQVLILALGLLCLVLGTTGLATLLGALYIYGPMALIAATVLQNPGGLDVRALLLLTTSSVFILITGLL